VGCLGECGLSNLVVVKLCNHKPLWIGGINDDAALDRLCRWLHNGANPTDRALTALENLIVDREHLGAADSLPPG